MQLSIISILLIFTATICALPLESKDIFQPPKQPPNQVINIERGRQYDGLEHFQVQVANPGQISALWKESIGIAGNFWRKRVYPLNPLDNGKEVMLEGEPLVKGKYVIKGISNWAKSQDVKDEIKILSQKGTLVAWADTKSRSLIKPRYIFVIECNDCYPASVPLSKGVKPDRLLFLQHVTNNNILSKYGIDVSGKDSKAHFLYRLEGNDWQAVWV